MSLAYLSPLILLFFTKRQKQKGGWHGTMSPLNMLLPRRIRPEACERMSYFKGGKHLDKRRSTFCVYAREKIEFIKQSPNDFY